jgi:hypothetical protein
MYTLFPASSDFMVAPNWWPDPQDPSETIFNLEVRLRTKPVLVLALKGPSSLQNISGRADADAQIRERLTDLAGECPVPALCVL